MDPNYIKTGILKLYIYKNPFAGDTVVISDKNHLLCRYVDVVK